MAGDGVCQTQPDLTKNHLKPLKRHALEANRDEPRRAVLSMYLKQL